MVSRVEFAPAPPPDLKTTKKPGISPEDLAQIDNALSITKE
jgi:hypothetical protein